MSKEARDKATQEAIEAFPVVRWLRSHTTVHSSMGGVVYADCPICQGKRKLGLYRRSKGGSKLAVCGRCKDGGHGQGRWGGVAGLPAFVKLLEGFAEWRDAFKFIHEMAEVPEAEWKPDRSNAGPPQLPDGCIPIDNLRDDERAVALLRERHAWHLHDRASLCIGGKYHERLILPCYQQEVYTGFEAKATHPGQELKSLYPPEMDTREILYTSRNWQGDDTRAALTESVLDAETFHSLSRNAVGCYGGLKMEQVSILLDLGVEELYWYLDGDAWELIPKGLRHTLPFFDNYLVPMPADEDPNSLGPDGCDELWDRARLVTSLTDHMALTEEWR